MTIEEILEYVYGREEPRWIPEAGMNRIIPLLRILKYLFKNRPTLVHCCPKMDNFTYLDGTDVWECTRTMHHNSTTDSPVTTPLYTG